MAGTRTRSCVVGVVAVAALTVSGMADAAPDLKGAEAYRDADEAVTALNILTPGQGRRATLDEVLRGIVPAHNDDQRQRYDALVQGAGTLTPAGLRDFFKDASFGVRPDDVERVYSPREGVVVIRDRSAGVPHVYGATRADVAFGAGYVHAEDRLFDADVNRHIGRGRLSELLGATPANLAVDRSVRLHADYTEDELQGQLDRLVAEHGALGAQVVDDFTANAAGFNAFIDFALGDPVSRLPAEYPALGIRPERWRTTDFVAVTAFVSWGFQGGGGQLRNAAVLTAIEAAGHPGPEARAIYEDFRQADDPEAPTTTDDPFRLNVDLGPVEPDSVARPDSAQAASLAAPAGSASAVPDHVDGPFGPLTVRPWPGVPSSNWLAVTRKLSASRRPLVVGGPQLGYSSPSVLIETDLHGPGIHVRGVTVPGLFPATPGAGRGTGYGWTATSPTVDQADIRAVKICDPNGGQPGPLGTFYLRDGRCIPMEVRTDQWLDPAGHEVRMTTERTVVGIVQERGTVRGEPVAFTLQRATAGTEAEFALSFLDIADPDKMRNVADMQRALARGSFAVNMIAFDGRDVAYITTGATPKLRPGIDRDLPFWGDSKWDWAGLLTFREHPQELNPKKGYSTNWNNKQAPGFTSDTFQYGPVYRSQLLDAAILARASDGKVDLVELVQAAEEAATQDLRGFAVLPLMLDVVDEPTDERLARAVALLREWHARGVHRRDLDLDGNYDNAAAVALMDRWFGPAVDAVFGPALGGALDAIPLGDRNSRLNSWGWANPLSKDLRTILQRPVQGPYSRIYCGNGDLDGCRKALLDTLDQAVSALEAAYGADPAGWDAQEELDRIHYGQTGNTGQWQNRPTFQQVLEFADKPERDAEPVDDQRRQPALGFGLAGPEPG